MYHPYYDFEFFLGTHGLSPEYPSPPTYQDDYQEPRQPKATRAYGWKIFRGLYWP